MMPLIVGFDRRRHQRLATSSHQAARSETKQETSKTAGIIMPEDCRHAPEATLSDEVQLELESLDVSRALQEMHRLLRGVPSEPELQPINIAAPYRLLHRNSSFPQTVHQEAPNTPTSLTVKIFQKIDKIIIRLAMLDVL